MPWDAPNFPTPLVTNWPASVLIGLAMLLVIGLLYHTEWKDRG